MVVGDGGIGAQNGHGGCALRGGEQVAVPAIEVDVVAHAVRERIVARVADGLIEG